MDKVKEAVTKYSEKEEAEVIRGRNSKIRITEKTKVSSPSKSSPERKAFEDEFKALDKWDEISTVDTNAIEKVVNEERWDKKIIDKIRPEEPGKVNRFLSYVNNGELTISIGRVVMLDDYGIPTNGIRIRADNPLDYPLNRRAIFGVDGIGKDGPSHQLVNMEFMNVVKLGDSW